jgi:hypothetical protein
LELVTREKKTEQMSTETHFGSDREFQSKRGLEVDFLGSELV